MNWGEQKTKKTEGKKILKKIQNGTENNGGNGGEKLERTPLEKKPGKMWEHIVGKKCPKGSSILTQAKIRSFSLSPPPLSHQISVVVMESRARESFSEIVSKKIESGGGVGCQAKPFPPRKEGNPGQFFSCSVTPFPRAAEEVNDAEVRPVGGRHVERRGPTVAAVHLHDADHCDGSTLSYLIGPYHWIPPPQRNSKET